jgi:hypothetical protein
VDVRRLLPLSGIVFVALVVVGVVVLGGDTPESDASAAEVSSFYGDEVVRQGIAAFVLAAAAPFVVFFASALAAHLGLGVGQEHRPIWERVVLAGSAVTASAAVVAALITSRSRTEPTMTFHRRRFRLSTCSTGTSGCHSTAASG